MKTNLKRMEGVTGAALYEAIIDTWNEIVDENESERHLVSEADWKAWTAAHPSVSESIKAVGREYERTGQWAGLERLRDQFQRTKYVSGDELTRRASAAAAEAHAQKEKQRQAAERSSLVSRLLRRVK